MTVTVLKHATIYTGLERIEDGYIRFDDKILAVGDMFDYQAQAGEQEQIEQRDEEQAAGEQDDVDHGRAPNEA